MTVIFLRWDDRCFHRSFLCLPHHFFRTTKVVLRSYGSAIRVFSSRAETAEVLRAIVAALYAARKRELLIRTIEARLSLFEKSDAEDTGSYGESNDRPTAEK
jgi:hypothetical protein